MPVHGRSYLFGQPRIARPPLEAEAPPPPSGTPPFFVAAGALAANNAVAALGIVAPTLAADDIMIAAVMNKHLSNTISPPDGTWTELAQDTNDCTSRRR